MLSNTLRNRFLNFYQNRHHTIVTSSPVFPHNDPSILFTNAGMNQFKDVFLNKESVNYSRATTSQKCIRAGGKHNDLENVGHTSRHLTFFEMLGNFSFGDYFKKEAIAFAWEASLSVFNFDPELIYITVHEKDDEAFALWERFLPTDRIYRLGDKDNFWSMADTGPCGFCSELLFDRGASFGSASSPLEDHEGERFLEYWNLVFMEFNRTIDGSLLPLPKKHVDTGAGLERLVSLISGAHTVFEADVLRLLIAKTEALSQKSYNPEEPLGAAFRVIADHVRSLSFAIADGLIPGNTERGYVLRKILRRAVNYGKRLGFSQPFLAEIVPTLVEAMGKAYPELQSAKTQIQDILSLEEESFFRTLRRGGNLLQQVLKHSSATISGEDAFTLKDTYGLPIDEIKLLARDHGYSVDMETFERLEKEARELSRQHHTKMQVDSNSVYQPLEQESSFVGYESLSCDSFIETIVHQGQIVTALKEGEKGELILSSTPFYAEKGGQVGDTGEIFSADGTFIVFHTTSPKPGLIIHHGEMVQGELKKTAAVTAQVDCKRRRKIANNHTACHLLHKALELTLGGHIRQAGSHVDETKVRLDFTHPKALSFRELRTLELLINEKIRENDPVRTREALYSDVMCAKEIKQFFGDKYGDIVRIVSVGGSHELCGGTHAHATGDLGYFRIVKEHAVATGIRRIEAATGEEAEALAYQDGDTLKEAALLIQSPKDQILNKVSDLLETRKVQAKTIQALENQLITAKSQELIRKCQTCGDVVFLVHRLQASESHQMQQYAQSLHQLVTHPSISLWFAEKGDKHVVLVKISDDLVQKGWKAQELLQAVLFSCEGRCGGKDSLAQGSASTLPTYEALNEMLYQWISTRSI